MVDQDDSQQQQPAPSPNTGASVPNDQPLTQEPLVNAVYDKPNAPGDDSIQPATSPIDLIAPAAVEAGVGAIGAAGRALAPQAERLMADETGMLTFDNKGLVQRAQDALSQDNALPGFNDKVKSAQKLVNDTYAGLLRGEVRKSEYEAAVSNLGKAEDQAHRHASQLAARGVRKTPPPQKYADGGAVQLPSPEDTNAAAQQATSNPLPESLPQQSAPQEMPLTSLEGQVTNVISPEGELTGIPSDKLHDALGVGYQLAPPELVQKHMMEEKYGTAGQQAKTALEGAASAASFGASTGLETALGVKPEDIQGRREVNPGMHTLGEIGGLGASMLAGVGEGALLGKAGAAAAEAVGLGAPMGIAARIGSHAVKAAAENAIFSAGDEASKAFSQDPNQSIEGAVADVGLSGLIGAGFGTALGTVPELWKAASGSKLGKTLSMVTNKLGGVEGTAVTTPVDQALIDTGVADTIKPEIRSALSNDPTLRNAASVLEQTDTGTAGPKFQQAMTEFRGDISKIQANALGVEPGEIAGKGEIDKYTAGKNIADSLANEWDEKVKPITQGYDRLADQIKGKDLVSSVSDRLESSDKTIDDAFGDLRKAQKTLQKALTSQDPSAAIEAEAGLRDAQANLKATQAAKAVPGTTDIAADRLTNLVKREGWNLSADSDVMKAVNQVRKDLPNLKTLGDLTQYIKQVGENTRSTLPFGQQTAVSRAGGMMKGILRDLEGELIESHVGERYGPEALEQYRANQGAFKQAAQLKDAVEDRLHASGASVSGYGKVIRAMGKTDGESVLRRLLGSSDADWLSTAQQHFPETAELIKQHHIDTLLAAAKDGEGLSSKKLIINMDKMSPQARDFAISEEAQGKIKAAHAISEQLNDKTHNFSNTARTIEKTLKGVSGSALGMVGVLTGHNPVTSALVGHLAEMLGKSVPDHARLALLKFMGSDAPLSATGFKAASDVIGRIVKGSNLVDNASKAVFTGDDVIPSSKIPTPEALERLDKKLDSFQKDQSPLLKMGGEASTYLPQHTQAMGETSTRVVNYVNSQRPQPIRISPLDPPVPPSDIQKDHFNNVLTIAQQPLVVLDRIQKGTITPQDVQAINAMYPKLYQNLVQKLTSAMMEHHSAEEPIDYHTRVGLSMFLGQPLDATMTPSAIQAAQPVPKLPQQPQTPPKRSTAKLSKVAEQNQTSSQAAEARRAGNQKD